MRKILVCFFLSALTIAAMAQKPISDANAEKRSVSGYHGVALSGNIELFLTQANEESVAISADDPKQLDKIITEVRNGILHIYLENKNKIRIDWRLNQKKIRAYVAIKNIDYLSSAGSGNVHIEGDLKADKLKIDISGSGKIKGNLAIKDLRTRISLLIQRFFRKKS